MGTDELRPKAGSNDGKGNRHVFVGLNENTFPNRQPLESAFRRWFPYAEDGEPNVEFDSKNRGLTVTVGNKAAVIVLLRVPIPGEEIRHASFNAFMWPKAWETLKQHKSPLIIVANGEYQERYDRSLFLTRVVAACTEAFAAAGIYWGDARIVHSPERFRREAVTTIRKPDDVPSVLWVGCLRRKADNGAMALYSAGLDRFGCMEIQIVHSRTKQRQFSTALYDGAIPRLQGQHNEGWRYDRAWAREEAQSETCGFDDRSKNESNSGRFSKLGSHRSKAIQTIRPTIISIE
jgi:hypothetical protein